ncbi:ImmA/IrrE family metallo-endopeptidase [Ramlibacter sp.]|uniref:ImmA/IrrE family metallo-endopeptidase n=1 Tax=Ramlibacter sp. TaxID=1917967 RepID=UPI002FC9D0BA
MTELEEIAELKASKLIYENPYAHEDDLNRLTKSVSRFDGIDIGTPIEIQAAKPRRRTDEEIEQLARRLQIRIWERRSEFFQRGKLIDPLDALDPVIAFKLLDYEVEITGALGLHPKAGDAASNVAGIIDKPNRKVLLSSGFPASVRNFTAAHELGHAVMHDFVGLHRDRPLDGTSGSQDPQEREAEKFAAYFLMPRKLLTKVFESIFGNGPFELTDETRFALAGALPRESRWQPRNRREISRVLASTPVFNGVNILPLMTQFRVSKEAMAIRLEQLALLR